MEIVLHIGVHCTDDDALLRSLVKNNDALVQQGVIIPEPARYRKLLRETTQAMSQGQIGTDSREVVLQKILGDQPCKRLILSNSNFICVPNRIFERGVLYGLADRKLAAIGNLFPNDDIKIMIGLRDPGSFIPAAFGRSTGRAFDSFLEGIQPDDLIWFDFLKRIRHAIPKASITAWCNEDTPLIWPQILRSMAGVPDNAKIWGGYDLIASVLSLEGLEKLKDYLRKTPPKSERHRQKILARFSKDLPKTAPWTTKLACQVGPRKLLRT